MEEDGVESSAALCKKANKGKMTKTLKSNKMHTKKINTKAKKNLPSDFV